MCHLSSTYLCDICHLSSFSLKILSNMITVLMKKMGINQVIINHKIKLGTTVSYVVIPHLWPNVLWKDISIRNITCKWSLRKVVVPLKADSMQIQATLYHSCSDYDHLVLLNIFSLPASVQSCVYYLTPTWGNCILEIKWILGPDRECIVYFQGPDCQFLIWVIFFQPSCKGGEIWLQRKRKHG